MLPAGEDETPDEGMIDLDTYERIQAQQPDEVATEDPDALPSVSDERLRELKEKARKMIDERLRAKRKQRRLMRGGN